MPCSYRTALLTRLGAIVRLCVLFLLKFTTMFFLVSQSPPSRQLNSSRRVSSQLPLSARLQLRKRMTSTLQAAGGPQQCRTMVLKFSFCHCSWSWDVSMPLLQVMRSAAWEMAAWLTNWWLAWMSCERGSRRVLKWLNPWLKERWCVGKGAQRAQTNWKWFQRRRSCMVFWKYSASSALSMRMLRTMGSLRASQSCSTLYRRRGVLWLVMGSGRYFSGLKSSLAIFYFQGRSWRVWSGVRVRAQQKSPGLMRLMQLRAKLRAEVRSEVNNSRTWRQNLGCLEGSVQFQLSRMPCSYLQSRLSISFFFIIRIIIVRRLLVIGAWGGWGRRDIWGKWRGGGCGGDGGASVGGGLSTF